MSHIVIDVDDWFDYSEVEFTGRKTPEPISLISSDEEDIPVKVEPRVKRESNNRPIAPVARNAAPRPSTIKHESPEPESSDEEKATYTIEDALREYPILDKEEVNETRTREQVNNPDDIFRKIIKPPLNRQWVADMQELEQQLGNSFKEPESLQNTRTRVIHKKPEPQLKRSLFYEVIKAADPTYRSPSSSLGSTGYNTIGNIPTSRHVLPTSFADWTYLRQVDRFKVAPGSINQISQSGHIVAVASSSVGGTNDELPSPYNEGPSLFAWRDGHAIIPMNDHSLYFTNGHPTEDVPMGLVLPKDVRGICAQGFLDDDPRSALKYYTVNDVQFDPRNPKHAMSAGSDKRLFAWEFEGEDDEFHARRVAKVTLRSSVDSIHYKQLSEDDGAKSDSSPLAIVAADGNICIYKYADIETTPLHLTPSCQHKCCGTISWGQKATDGYIFVTWEPQHGLEPYNGYHMAYDVTTGRCIYRFSSSNDPGSAIDISPDGRVAAIATNGPAGHKVRLYDITRQSSDPGATINVNDMDRHHREQNISHIKFDPYGDYLAIGRPDNVVQIIDRRNTGTVLRTFYHGQSIAVPGPGEGKIGGESFGITGLRWVTGWQGMQLRLFSGGEDGNVRMWNLNEHARDFRDPESAVFKHGQDPINGFEVAREHSPIASFSMGKTGRDDLMEMALVVGDSSGQVTVYDRKGAPHYRHFGI